jgi:hypothetical protein
MKIGFSFGRCVRDIVDGVVNINDVLLIIGRTRMPDEKSCEWVIDEYLQTHYLRGRDPARCHEVGLELYRTRRVIEPRGVGAHAMQVPADCVWMDLFPTVTDNVNEAVRVAWEQYRMLIGLSSHLPEIDEQALKHRALDQLDIPVQDTACTPTKRKRKTKAQKAAEAEQKRVLDLLASCIV